MRFWTPVFFTCGSTSVFSVGSTSTSPSVTTASFAVEPEAKEAVVTEGEVDVEPTEKTEVEPQVKKTGVQKRIDKLTARNYQLEEAADQERQANADLRARLERLEQSVAGRKAEPTVAEPAGKPKEDDFKVFADYQEALTDWKVDQKLAA